MPAAALLLFLGGGCGDDGTGPGLPPRISITPEAPVALYIGDTLTVRATIRNMVHAGVTYTSSDPEVVAVDENTGVVTAIAPGEAWVSGVSVIDPRINARVDVTVLPDLAADVTIRAVLGSGGAEVDPAAVAGDLAVALSVSPGNALGLELSLGDEVVCEEPFTPPSAGGPPPAAVEVDCSFATGAFDPADGTPRFLNGDHPLTARLVASGERTLAGTPEQVLTLQNPSVVAGVVTAARAAVDAAGNAWSGGDLAVRAIPVLYDAQEAVGSITLAYGAPGGRDTTATDAAAPYEFTLPAAGILAGVTDAALRITLTSSTSDGGTGPAGGTEPVRFDGAPPVPGSFIAREWIGAQTRFVDTYSAAGESDAGVGRVHLKFFAGDPTLAPPALAANGQAVVVGADLSQAAAGSYRVVARVCDGLDNCTLLGGFLFGVDLTAPIVESVSIADRARNPGADLLLGIRDDLSGFAEAPLETTALLLDASPATAACGPAVEAMDLPGRPLGGVCAPDTVGNPVRVPRTTAGYYTYSVVAFDRAGNRSAQVNREILVDLQPPDIGPLQVPTPLEPGATVVVTALVGDDVEMMEVDFALVFPLPGGTGALAVPFGPPTSVGVPFDDALTTEAEAAASVPVVRTLTFANTAPGARPTVLLDSMRAGARDAAGLSASTGRNLSPSDYGGDASTADPYQRFATAALSVDRTSVCTGGCSPSDPADVRLTVRVDGESGTGIPFAQIHFYRRADDGSLSHLGSRAGGEATITNAGNRSTYTYTFDHSPPPFLVGEYAIVAVGVNSRGSALATPLATAPRVTFYAR